MTSAKAKRVAEQRALEQHRELVCAAIACDVLGADSFQRRDLRGVGGLSGMHDFDVLFPDGNVEALEVCAYTDEDVQAQWAAASDLEYVSSSLSLRWRLHIGATVRVKNLAASAEPYLQVLEEHRVSLYEAGHHFTLQRKLGAHARVIASAGLAGLGVDYALGQQRLPGEAAAISFIGRTGGIGSGEILNGAVESRAWEPGNRRKLSAAQGAAARHLFVPVASQAGVIWTAVFHGPPSTPPSLPPDVSRAWVIGRGDRVLFVEPGQPWQTAPINQCALDKPEAWLAESRLEGRES